MKKKILLIIIVAVIACVGVLGLTACDSYTASESGIIYRMVDKRYQVFGIEADAEQLDVVIPARFENIEVIGIAREAFKGNPKITSVTIEEGVRSIASSAFEGCTALTSVKIPNSVTLIGTYIFRNCIELSHAELPTNLTILSGGMFFGCTALTNISLPETTTKISDNAFENSGLTTIELPAGVTEIGERAFSNCSELSSVILSNSLQTIGRLAFQHCEELTSITLPQAVNRIYAWAFSESGLINATFVDTTSWRVAPHNYVQGDNNTELVIEIEASDLQSTELAAMYLVNNSSFNEEESGYANYIWYKQ